MHEVIILPNGMVLIRDGDRVLYLRKGITQWDGPWVELPKAAKKALAKYRDNLMPDTEGPFRLWY